jgi:hypothetical protein
MGRDRHPDGPALSHRSGVGGKEVLALRPIRRSPPHLIMAEPPRPRIEAIRIVDMSSSNSWAEFAALFRNTREAFIDHERAKGELKALMPEDAKEAIGHGVRAKRSKAGAVSFDVLTTEAADAPVQ